MSKKLSKAQIAAFEQQGANIDNIFRSIAGILNKQPLDRGNKKKLVSVVNFLNKASNLLASIAGDEDDEEGEGEE